MDFASKRLKLCRILKTVAIRDLAAMVIYKTGTSNRGCLHDDSKQ